MADSRRMDVAGHPYPDRVSTPQNVASVRSPSPMVLIAIIVTVLAWASAFIVIRGTAPYFDGGAVALGRLVIGTVLLGVVVAIGRRWVWPTRREWISIAVFGVAWFGGYNVALNIAEHTLDAGTTAMLVNIGPILIALGAGIFLREGIPKWLAIGAGVSFLGVIIIGIASTGGHLGGGIGILWCLVAAVLYTAGVLFQKPALKRLPNAQVTWLGCVIGMLACLPFTGELVRGLHAAPVGGWLGILYLGVCAFEDAGWAARRLHLYRSGARNRARAPRFWRRAAGFCDRRRCHLPGGSGAQSSKAPLGSRYARKSGRIASRVFSRPTL
jgi:drug/metabolite transporter (DMT)-like permease